MERTEILKLGVIEKYGLLLTAALGLLCWAVGSASLGLGVGVGGGLAVVNFFAIKMVVGALIGRTESKGFAVFVMLVKMAVFVGLVLGILLFTTVSIYGFLIGVFGVVLVIIAESLRGSVNGSF